MSENSQTFDNQRLSFNLSDKIDLKRSDKYVALSNDAQRLSFNLSDKIDLKRGDKYVALSNLLL